MTNSYYNPTMNPATNSQGSSSVIRNEFTDIAAGFALFPAIAANAGRAFIIDPTASFVTLTVGQLSLGGNLSTSGALTTTGAFSTIFAQQASVTLTLPTVTGTLATLDGTETLTNKTLTSPALTGVPTAPTASPGTNTTQVATTAFTAASQVVVTALVAAETARAEAAEALLAPRLSPALTGVPTAPTAAFLTNSTQIATTAFIATAVAGAGVITANSLTGYTLSNDGTTPNTVLDIAIGRAADSLNGVVIALASPITKSISATWAVGSGNGGMGTGLTATASTWYHVFAIINSAAVDVYFDTSITAANKPAGTTSFRRIGTFATDSSAHILPFVQNGDRFDWTNTPPLAFSGAISASTTMNISLSTPLGLALEAILSGLIISPTDVAFYISSLYTTSFSPSALTAVTGVGAQGGVFNIRVVTDTSSRVRLSAGAGGSTFVEGVYTVGWVDTRGK